MEPFSPLTPFTKIWRMRNNGTVVLPRATKFVWIGGDKLSNTFSVEAEVPAAGLAVDTELDMWFILLLRSVQVDTSLSGECHQHPDKTLGNMFGFSSMLILLSRQHHVLV